MQFGKAIIRTPPACPDCGGSLLKICEISEFRRCESCGECFLPPPWGG